MSTYKKEVGTAVQNAAGTLSGVVEGQLWYDSTAASFKYQYPNVTSAGAWSTGGNMNTARYILGGAVQGTQDAGLGFGGYQPPPGFNNIAATESYNGASWTEVNDLNTGKAYMAAAGNQGAAITIGGQLTGGNTPISETESWNGTSWTEVNDLNTARSGLAGAGSQTSALAFGGENPPGLTGVTESWNGTSWTTNPATMNTARRFLAGSGDDNTTALAFGGQTPSTTGETESWNGTSWTEVNDLNTARDGLGGFGSSTAALAFGGRNPSVQAVTEIWNGTSWSEDTDLSTARMFLAGGGTSTSGLAFAGYNGTALTAATEEWLGAGQPVGAWSTGGSLNTQKQNMVGVGTAQTAALSIGGEIPPSNTKTGQTELYDGTSWTELNDLNTARAKGAGGGTSTAALTFGGSTPTITAVTESWNGSAWTEVNDLNQARQLVAGCGANNTACLAFGGEDPGTANFALTELWNGTSWTEVADLNTARNNLPGSGTSTSALGSGGYVQGGTANVGITESWNGT